MTALRVRPQGSRYRVVARYRPAWHARSPSAVERDLARSADAAEALLADERAEEFPGGIRPPRWICCAQPSIRERLRSWPPGTGPRIPASIWPRGRLQSERGGRPKD